VTVLLPVLPYTFEPYTFEPYRLSDQWCANSESVLPSRSAINGVIVTSHLSLFINTRQRRPHGILTTDTPQRYKKRVGKLDVKS